MIPPGFAQDAQNDASLDGPADGFQRFGDLVANLVRQDLDKAFRIQAGGSGSLRSLRCGERIPRFGRLPMAIFRAFHVHQRIIPASKREGSIRGPYRF